MADKHLNKCKLCCRKQEQERRLNTPNYRQEYEQKRWQENEERRRLVKDYRQRLRKNSPEKDRAWATVGRALKSGKLKREPCLYCGSITVEAHHEDYNKPLNVIWVCHACHLREFHLTRIAESIDAPVLIG